MAPSQTVTEHKIKLWADRINSWQRSGLSQRAYCEQQQRVLGTFAYWRGRLKKLDASHPAHKPMFLPVTLQQPCHESRVIDLVAQWPASSRDQTCP